jgi:preprotein translocase subunit SecF
MSYSLYDTVVVFDKVRENTLEIEYSETRTFGEMVNLAVNQTLVRSVNTSVVAVLPTAAILFIGSLILGAGTLRDIALALFVGTIVGTYSSVFLAAPIYVHLREGEPQYREAEAKVQASRE